MISHKTLLYANTLLFVGLAGGLKAAPIASRRRNKPRNSMPLPATMRLLSRKHAKIDAHTVELRDENNRKITVDFYGNNIFRIYQDPAGSAPTTPKQNLPPTSSSKSRART